MIYSGKETQTTSNGQDNGVPLVAAPIITESFSSDSTNSGDSTPDTPLSPVLEARNVYYNPRLDPKNFLEGPLSPNAATRLRQLLARPGIVVSPNILDHQWFLLIWDSRLLLVSVMASVLAVLSKLASTASTKGIHIAVNPHTTCANVFCSGAATTASRLGQPDLAIATLNDFAEAAEMVCSLSPSTPVIADADTG